jgi:hypothetical protein
MVSEADEKVSESTPRSSCPLCWGQHDWTDIHEIVAMAPGEDQFKLFATLSRLGVSWPGQFNLMDTQERSYGVLRMIDDAALLGLDCSAVGDRWVITRAKTPRHMRTAA